MIVVSCVKRTQTIALIDSEIAETNRKRERRKSSTLDNYYIDNALFSVKYKVRTSTPLQKQRILSIN